MARPILWTLSTVKEERSFSNGVIPRVVPRTRPGAGTRHGCLPHRPRSVRRGGRRLGATESLAELAGTAGEGSGDRGQQPGKVDRREPGLRPPAAEGDPGCDPGSALA